MVKDERVANGWKKNFLEVFRKPQVEGNVIYC